MELRASPENSYARTGSGVNARIDDEHLPEVLKFFFNDSGIEEKNPSVADRVRVCLRAALSAGRLDVAEYLLLLGTATTPDVLRCDIPPAHRTTLSVSLKSIVLVHDAFVRGLIFGPTLASSHRHAANGSAAKPSALRLLEGHESTLLVLIADFSGVIRGQKLRSARKTLELLEVLARQKPVPWSRAEDF